MAKSWLICECFTKYPSKTFEFFKTNTCDKFTINKAISKIRDSYRVNKQLKTEVLKYKKE